MDYQVNYENTEDKTAQEVVSKISEIDIKTAFAVTAQLEAEAFLYSGKNDGNYSVTPVFRSRF